MKLLLLLLAGCVEYQIQPRQGFDSWQQLPREQVDLLLVVDNSCSMLPYQTALAQSLPELTRYLALAEVDWQLGVTDTDAIHHQGALRGSVLGPDNAELEAAFACQVDVGTEGSGFEMGLESALAAVEGASETELRRPGAALSLLFVTDEEDHSPRSAVDYAGALAEAAGAGRGDLVASGLVVTDTSSCAEVDDFQGSAGSRYLWLAEQTGGTSRDLCADGFSSLVDDVALDFSRLEDHFVLSQHPAIRSLEVSVDGVAVPCGPERWQAEILSLAGEDRTAVVFSRDALPPGGAWVSAQYDLGTAPAEGCP